MYPIRIDRLGAEQHAGLDHATRTAKDGRLRIRALIVLLAAERGMAAADIAALVRRRPRALGPPSSLWTGDRLSDCLAERTGVRVSRASVYRLPRAGGVHLNRPQHTITSPDPEYAVKKRRWSAPAIS